LLKYYISNILITVYSHSSYNSILFLFVNWNDDSNEWIRLSIDKMILNVRPGL